MINGRKLFNNLKCWILIPLGWGNARHKYGLGEQSCRKGSGVLVDSRLSVRHQRANPILGCIKQSNTSHSKLSCCSQCWMASGLTGSTVCSSGPHHGRRMWKSLNASRRGQSWWKAGRMSYEEQLRTLGLPSLEKSRMTGNLIILYSFLRGESGEGGAELFSWVCTDRMSGWKLPQERFRLDIRKHFFTEGMVKPWNRLPKELIDAFLISVLTTSSSSM